MLILRQGSSARREFRDNIAVTHLRGKGFWKIRKERIALAIISKRQVYGPQFPTMTTLLHSAAERLRHQLVAKTNTVQRNGTVRGATEKILTADDPWLFIVRRGW